MRTWKLWRRPDRGCTDLPSGARHQGCSLVAGNTAAKSSGGIDVVGTNGGSFKLDNSTVSGNDSSSHGGGVAIRRVKQDNKISLFESTITGKTSVGFYGGVSTDDSAEPRRTASSLPTTLRATVRRNRPLV